jgi:hypothetical protein
VSDETAEQEPVEVAGEEEKPSRIAGALVLLVLAGVGIVVLKVVVTAFPYVAYFVAGALACWGWQKARGWLAHRRGSGPESSGSSGRVTREDVVETLHAVANPNVFLADFAAAFDLDTTAGRALLEGQEIRVRRAVRNGESTGVGVHRDDVPPLPRPLSDTPERGVDLHNQRPTVEAIGLAGVVVKDGSETARRHRIQ